MRFVGGKTVPARTLFFFIKVKRFGLGSKDCCFNPDQLHNLKKPLFSFQKLVISCMSRPILESEQREKKKYFIAD